MADEGVSPQAPLDAASIDPEWRESGVMIHPTADVSDDASIGAGTHVWNEAQVRGGAVIGTECILGKGSYVDFNVRVGDRCKLENGAFVFHGFTLQAGVFLGPGVMLLNDHEPRAINADGTLKTAADWVTSEGVIERGASVGGGAIVLPRIRVRRYAVVGAGAVVTRDVPPHGIVYGNPARLHGFACRCGHPVMRGIREGTLTRDVEVACDACGSEMRIEAIWAATQTG